MSENIIELQTYLTSRLPRQLTNAGIATVNRISRIVKKKAIEAYKVERQKTEMPSQVINSFTYDIPSVREQEIKATVFCDTGMAPHVLFLLEDRPLRNGVMWSAINPSAPYKFMTKGYLAGDVVAKQIALEELKRNII